MRGHRSPSTATSASLRARFAPYACAALNAGAAIALAALSRGTLAQPDVQARADFVDQHLLAWRSGWAVWMAASSSLLVFYAWWGRELCGDSAPACPQSGREDPVHANTRQTRAGAVVRGTRHGLARAASPLAIAGVGLAFDLIGESLQIVAVPDAPALMPLAVLLTAGVANGSYTAAGALLTMRTRLHGWRAAWTWAVWAAGAGVSVMAFMGSVSGLVVTSALLFALFCPWCIALERWLRR
ncbi:MAG: hypothetical protein ABR525_04950 [Candidatus Limnocylindria bacterium]